MFLREYMLRTRDASLTDRMMAAPHLKDLRREHGEPQESLINLGNHVTHLSVVSAILICDSALGPNAENDMRFGTMMEQLQGYCQWLVEIHASLSMSSPGSGR